MLYEVNKQLIIPFLVINESGQPIESGVSPVCVIKRMSDGYYWNGTDWQSALFANYMIHSFKGVWIFSFTPQSEDLFIIRCSETTYRNEDGILVKTVSRITNLDYLDASISSRLATSDFNTSILNVNNKLDVIDINTDSVLQNTNDLNTKLTTVRANNLDYLDASVSSRSSHSVQDIWTYQVRSLTPSNIDGVGTNVVTINCKINGLLAQDVNVFVYDKNRQFLNSAKSNINGQVVFYLNNGDYYFEFRKDGIWTKEVFYTIIGNFSFDIDLVPVSSTGYLAINFRELSNPPLEISSEVLFGIEVFATIGKTFTIDSASCTITGTDTSINCTIEGQKVYAKLPVTTRGWNYIVFSVVIGGQTYKYKIKKYVD